LSGIQALVTDDTADPYVRHSGGKSIADDNHSSMGALSKPPWEQSLLEQETMVEEPLPEPVARLSNGEAKPVVTLIDFPQMISVRHVNAQDYYERDLQCVQNFFIHKLQCQIPLDTCPVTQYAQWENVVRLLGRDNNSSNATNQNSNRMDTTLRASGFSQSQQDSSDRMLELYYFTDGPRPIASAVIPEDDEEEDDGDDDDENDNDENQDKEVDDNYNEEVDDDNEEWEDDNNKEGEDDDHNDLVSHADSRMNPIIGGFEHLHCQSSDTRSATRDEIIALTKQKVQKQVQEQMKRPKKPTSQPNGKRNMNKSYIKGKRVHADVF
jgi:RIO1 family